MVLCMCMYTSGHDYYHSDETDSSHGLYSDIKNNPLLDPVPQYVELKLIPTQPTSSASSSSSSSSSVSISPPNSTSHDDDDDKNHSTSASSSSSSVPSQSVSSVTPSSSSSSSSSEQKGRISTGQPPSPKSPKAANNPKNSTPEYSPFGGKLGGKNDESISPLRMDSPQARKRSMSLLITRITLITLITLRDSSWNRHRLCTSSRMNTFANTPKLIGLLVYNPFFARHFVSHMYKYLCIGTSVDRRRRTLSIGSVL